MSIPFIDLKAQFSLIEKTVNANIQKVLSHGQFIMGPEITELEKRAAKFAKTSYALSCGSGTDALMLAFMALGIGSGDAVFTTPFTFMATAETIALLGATPVFVDIDPVTYNIDSAKLEIAIQDTCANRKDLTPKAVVPVDLFGLPANYDALLPVAKKYGLQVVIDAAQSFGATVNGTCTSALGDIACTSFFPAKPLGCYGDGGMCFTHSKTLYETMVSLRIHGMNKEDKYDNIRLGLNARMDTLQAAILLPKLEIFAKEIEKRNQLAARYTEKLQNSSLVTPTVPQGMKSVWAQYCLQAENTEHRSAVQAKLQKAGIPMAIYYPLPLHLQQAYAYLNYNKGDMPVSEAVGKRIFALPMHPYLDKKTQDMICQTLLN